MTIKCLIADYDIRPRYIGYAENYLGQRFVFWFNGDQKFNHATAPAQFHFREVEADWSWPDTLSLEACRTAFSWIDLRILRAASKRDDVLRKLKRIDDTAMIVYRPFNAEEIKASDVPFRAVHSRVSSWRPPDWISPLVGEVLSTCKEDAAYIGRMAGDNYAMRDSMAGELRERVYNVLRLVGDDRRPVCAVDHLLKLLTLLMRENRIDGRRPNGWEDNANSLVEIAWACFGERWSSLLKFKVSMAGELFHRDPLLLRLLSLVQHGYITEFSDVPMTIIRGKVYSGDLKYLGKEHDRPFGDFLQFPDDPD